MTESSTQPLLKRELDAIARWRSEQAEALDQALVTLAGEDQELRERLVALQRSIEENAERQRELKRELAGLPQQVVARAHQALLDALQQDRAVVEARSNALQEVRELALMQLEEQLQEPETAAAIEEYDKFREVEPVLGSLPPSYRQVVMDHHASLKKRLAPMFELAAGPTEPLDLEPATVMLAASLELADGRASAFALFLPVDHQVYRSWADRPEDLAAQFAYRVVAGVSRALERLGAPDAPVVYQDFSGCISIQVWLDDHDVDADVAAVVEEAVAASLADAPELAQVHLRMQLAWVDPEIVGPEEDHEADDHESGQSPATADDDDKKLKPVQIVLRRGGSDHW
ncbi:MAG: hypothetical protein ABIO70_22495 [Pseudomonadota bacterium]